MSRKNTTKRNPGSVCRLAEKQDVIYETLENSVQGLARHVLAIKNHPLCPDRLYDAICDFITDGTNLKDESGDTLLNCWAYDPKTVEAILVWAKSDDDKCEMAAELQGGDR
jgi:hypothetical protein